MHGVQIVNVVPHKDDRGEFVKFNSKELFKELPKDIEFKENFYSTSIAGSIRGFHLQIGISENFRVIHAMKGVIYDVLVDLRFNSDTFGKYQSTILDSSVHQSLLIPPGVAHGFQSLTESTVVYASSESYQENLDTGINPINDFKDWPIGITKISDRDMNLPSISEYKKRFYK